MTITLQAKQANGTWAVRNAFTTENAKVVAGSMTADELETKARKLMAQWQATMQDGKQLRVHNSDNDPKAAARKTKPEEIAARALGWVTEFERHGVDDHHGVVHPRGYWAPDWRAAVAFTPHAA